MPPYKSPEFGSQFMVKLLRVDSKLVTGAPNDQSTQFPDLAKSEGIFETLRRRVIEDPDAGDAAVLYVFPNQKINVTQESSSLGLPLTQRAREITIEQVRQLSPDYDVSG